MMSAKEDEVTSLSGDSVYYVSLVHADGAVQEVGHSECVNTVFQIASRAMKAHGAHIVKVKNCPSGKKAMVIGDAADLVPFFVRIAGCCITSPDAPTKPDPNYRDYVSLVDDFNE